jgi:tetratricopeptide (TPR) repeat protein
MEWLDAERLNLLAATRWAVDQRAWPVAWQISGAMWPLFLHRKHYLDWLEFDRLGLVAARGGGDRVAEARMLNRLGLACTELGRFAEATEHHRTALAIWRDVGDRRKEADTVRRLGLVQSAAGQPADALRLFERSQAVFEEVGDTRSTAIALSERGRALITLGRPRDALAVLERALLLFTEVADPYNQADVGILLAHLHCLGGDLEEAESLLSGALAEMTARGSTAGTVRALEVLADTAEQRGDVPALLEHLLRAADLYDRLELHAEADRVRARAQGVTTPPEP